MASASGVPVCSIGSSLQDSCHETTLTKFMGNKKFEEFSEREKELLVLRSKVVPIKLVCYHHEKIYLTRFESINGRYCCDPFKKHAKKVESK